MNDIVTPAKANLVQKFAASRSGAWLLARVGHHLDRIFLRLSGERVMLSSLLVGLPVVMVDTIGAKTGHVRRIPLLCIRDQQQEGDFAVIASNFGQGHNPAWYYNLKAHPEVSCTLYGKVFTYRAGEAEGDEYQRFWRYALATYIGFPGYKQRAGARHIPVMVLRRMGETQKDEHAASGMP